MNIYIDESGSFVNAPKVGSWNVVCAYVAPEYIRSKLESLLSDLKRISNFPLNAEVKLYQLDESKIIYFLKRLNSLNGAFFCVATDAGYNKLDAVEKHQRHQVQAVRVNIPRMRYEGGREGIELLANQLELLSSQLYVQLMCQVSLMYDVVSQSINYYAQRVPATLSAYRWRIDQKSSKTYEDAFEKIAPTLLQSRTFREPMAFVKGFNYSKMQEYEFTDKDSIERLKDAYGVNEIDGFDIQKIIRKDIQFVDSKSCYGVQVADLLASATRKCLRHEFNNNNEIATLLGSLMIQRSHKRTPIDLLSFGERTLPDKDAEIVAILMRRAARGMFATP